MVASSPAVGKIILILVEFKAEDTDAVLMNHLWHPVQNFKARVPTNKIKMDVSHIFGRYIIHRYLCISNMNIWNENA